MTSIQKNRVQMECNSVSTAQQKHTQNRVKKKRKLLDDVFLNSSTNCILKQMWSGLNVEILMKLLHITLD